MDEENAYKPVVDDRTAAIILAAGKGERYSGQTHKLLADFRGKPVLQWVIDNVIEADFTDIYLVSGAINLFEESTLNLSSEKITIVQNHNFEQG